MEERLNKTEARQGVRRRWQERTLFLSLGGATVVLIIVTVGFLAFS